MENRAEDQEKAKDDYCWNCEYGWMHKECRELKTSYSPAYSLHDCSNTFKHQILFDFKFYIFIFILKLRLPRLWCYLVSKYIYFYLFVTKWITKLQKRVAPIKVRTTESHPDVGVKPRKSLFLTVSPHIKKAKASKTPEAKLPPILLIIFLGSFSFLERMQLLITNMTIDITIVTFALRKCRESIIGFTV